MNSLAIILVALSLSADTFAVAFAKNSNARNNNGPMFSQGIMFGLGEMSMFLLGWFVATRYANLISSIDHWIAFFILSAVGLHMLHAAITENTEISPTTPPASSNNKNYFWFVFTVIGTSIDAAAVGVTFAVIDVDIVFAACTIGLSSLFMSMLAVFLSKKTGLLLGRYAEILGGTILILIGFFILYSHM